MGLPQLERCCFVFDLKTGNIIMGCLNAFLTFTLLVTMIVEASMAGAVNEVIKNDAEVADMEAAASAAGLYAMSIILVIMFLAKFMFDLVFIYGVIAERASIIKAYFVMWMVFFILSMFTFFVNVTGYTAWTITMELIYIGFNLYAILLSHSYYKMLNNREIV